MPELWDTQRIQPLCQVCGGPATVDVIAPDGTNHGPHCGLHADARVNEENFPLRCAANPEWTDPNYATVE